MISVVVNNADRLVTTTLERVIAVEPDARRARTAAPNRPPSTPGRRGLDRVGRTAFQFCTGEASWTVPSDVRNPIELVVERRSNKICIHVFVLLLATYHHHHHHRLPVVCSRCFRFPKAYTLDIPSHSRRGAAT